MKQTSPDVCTLKTCDRKKIGVGSLLCPAHWALTPRELKLALWRAEKLRSRKAQQFETMCAAGDILDWLEKNVKVALPPEVSIIQPSSELEKPQSNEPRIIHP